MTRLTLLTILSILIGVASASADELVFENGDRVSGTILGLDLDGLAIESEFLGTVTAQWDAVQQLQADGPLYLTFSDDEVVLGSVVIDGAAATVQTADAGSRAFLRSQIVTIRSAARQDAFLQAQEDELNAAGAAWAASADGGLSMTSGNARTRSMTLGLLAARTTRRDRTSFYLTSLLADNSTSGETLTTANAVRGGGRYERDVTRRVFTFGFSDLEFDRFQDLDLRLVLGGGLGLNLVESANNTFQIFGGGSSNQEFFSSSVRRKSGESVLGEEWTYRLNSVTSFTERLAVYPNLTDTGQYRINFDSTAVIRLNGWLSWQVTLSDRFLSNPRPGKQKNDLLFTTGIRITLGDRSVGSVGPGNINFR